MSIKSILESVLYVSGDEGIEVSDLKKILEIPTDDIRTNLKNLKNQYDNNVDCGFTIKVFGNRYHLLSKPENKEQIIKLLGFKRRNPLTPSNMETLSIIAYNQPCTISKIEDIRGVDCSAAVAKLVELGLVEQVGRVDGPGRAFQYEVTQKFFNTFGIKSLSELPKINELSNEVDDYDNLDFFDVNRHDD